jgi:hypothetical protein
MNARHPFGMILSFLTGECGGRRRGSIHSIPSHINSRPGPTLGGDDLLCCRFHTSYDATMPPLHFGAEP